ncbi:MAG: ATP-binding protein [Halorientalis sp.]
MIASQAPVVQGFYYGATVAAVVFPAVLGWWIYANHWEERGARWFTLTVLGGGAWNLFLLLNLLPVSAGIGRLSVYLRVLSVHVSLLAFAMFGSVYSERNFHREPVQGGTMGGVLGGYLVLALTSPWHDLLFVRFEHVTEPFPYLIAHRNVGYLVLVTVLAVLMAYTTAVLVRYLLSTPRQSGGKIALLLVGLLAIGTFDFAGRIGLFPADGLPHSGFGTLLFFVCTYLAVFRFRLLDLKPVARNTVVENLRDPVLVVDDRRRVVDYNAAATHVWPDLAAQVPAAFESVCPALAETVDIPPGDDQTTERVSLSYDGQERHYSGTVAAVGEADDGGGWHSILLRDVTELERSRWQLEKQNDRLDQVASTISHDLRNPITVVEGNVELADIRLDQADLDTADREAVDEPLHAIEDATGRMQDIIDDILTIAREGKTVEDTEPVSLDDVARDAWETVDTKQARLTVADDCRFQADRSKLRTIFENCFRNALDHGPADVTVEVGPTPDGFYVADDGPGIPAEHADSVFEYGYTTSEEGTGLGLSIVRTMAESHGWTVEHDADYEEGTRFVFGTVDIRSGQTEDEG